MKGQPEERGRKEEGRGRGGRERRGERVKEGYNLGIEIDFSSAALILRGRELVVSRGEDII